MECWTFEHTTHLLLGPDLQQKLDLVSYGFSNVDI